MHKHFRYTYTLVRQHDMQGRHTDGHAIAGPTHILHKSPYKMRHVDDYHEQLRVDELLTEAWSVLTHQTMTKLNGPTQGTGVTMPHTPLTGDCLYTACASLTCTKDPSMR